jgi:hypothetical protein
MVKQRHERGLNPIKLGSLAQRTEEADRGGYVAAETPSVLCMGDQVKVRHLRATRRRWQRLMDRSFQHPKEPVKIH